VQCKKNERANFFQSLKIKEFDRRNNGTMGVFKDKLRILIGRKRTVV
jgi:hypothetical protein